ncbi:HSP20-like chaperones superfamily protein [Hibiscus syriacus]|uniref:HSP20-like chaperones superfamily protein n=1 Tax=Hibiscus syriacus TaxID=106335 RepID=A0A6A3CM34_HIBSY|nr:HSP20-like chaperones superfamily protein [Hibiscus syriacus]
MAMVVAEIVWLKGLLVELGVKDLQPAKHYCDNKAALQIAANPVFHERTKHIEIDCHFIREKIQEGVICTEYVSSTNQLADVLTKALDFLSSDVMHREGNLLAHLVIVGYKISHRQSALVEFDFQVSGLFLDLQDGVRLCRVIQLLQHEPSILMKIVVPSDTLKKNLANCGVALQYLREAGVVLCDEDGLKITRDDIAERDKERTVSLLWNIFVRLQLPLLIDKTTIGGEISNIRGFNMICFKCSLSTGEKWGWQLVKIMVLGLKAFLHWSMEKPYDAVHNFVLSQKLTALLGNFPEVLQISDLSITVQDSSIFFQDQLNFHKLLGCNCQNLERRHSLTQRQLASSEGVVQKKERDLDITEDASKNSKVILAWWQDMTEQNYNSVVKPAASTSSFFPAQKISIDISRELEKLVKFIAERHSFVNLRRSVLLIQRAARSWIAQRPDTSCPDLVKAAIVIQKCFRGGVVRSIHIIENASLKGQENGLSISETEAATRVQIAWKNFVCRYQHKQTSAANKIQSHFRSCPLRRNFMKQKQAIIKIQSNFRLLKSWRAFQTAQKEFVCRYIQNQTFAATKIQSHYQGWHLRRSFMKQKQAIIKVQSNYRQLKCWRAFQVAQKEFAHRSLQKQTFAATKIQSHFRGWQLRSSFIKQKQAILPIQSNFRRLKCLSAFQQYKIAARSAIDIQSSVRGWIARTEYWKHRYLIVVIQEGAVVGKGCCNKHPKSNTEHLPFMQLLLEVTIRHCRGWLVRKELLLKRDAVIKIQRAIQRLIHQKAFHLQKLAAIKIRRVIRGQIARSMLLGLSSFHAATAGDCTCKMSEGFFQSFELTVLITSVLKLQRYGYSSFPDCEELVAAGAISTLLNLICSASRSIPDQEVLKHALSTLRNLARYPHLIQVLIETPRSVEIFLRELQRPSILFSITS